MAGSTACAARRTTLARPCSSGREDPWQPAAAMAKGVADASVEADRAALLLFLLRGANAHRHLDGLGHDGRVVRDVVLVGEQELQRVPARRQRDPRFGLTGAEMQMVEVVRDR